MWGAVVVRCRCRRCRCHCSWWGQGGVGDQAWWLRDDTYLAWAFGRRSIQRVGKHRAIVRSRVIERIQGGRPCKAFIPAGCLPRIVLRPFRLCKRILHPVCWVCLHCAQHASTPCWASSHVFASLHGSIADIGSAGRSNPSVSVDTYSCIQRVLGRVFAWHTSAWQMVLLQASACTAPATVLVPACSPLRPGSSLVCDIQMASGHC